jgi:hypothetical protein
MIKQTIKYVRALRYKNAFSSFIGHVPNAIQFLILIALVATFFQYREANILTKRYIELNQRSLGLAQSGNELNQKSLGLTEKSVTLTQQSVDLTKQAFKTSHIPWISVEELTVGDPQDSKIVITVNVKNSSDTPAFNVSYDVSYVDDRMDADTSNPIVQGLQSDGAATWMPNETYFLAFSIPTNDPQNFKNGIDNGDVIFSTKITYTDIFGGSITLRETWNKQNGRFINPASTVDYPDYSKQ